MLQTNEAQSVTATEPALLEPGAESAEAHGHPELKVLKPMVTWNLCSATSDATAIETHSPELEESQRSLTETQHGRKTNK